MVKRVLLSIIAFILVILSASFIFIFGSNKGYEIRQLAATTILSTQHRHWAKYTFLPQTELNKLLEQINNPKYKNSDLSSNEIQKQKEEVIVSVKTIEKRYNATNYYKGKIMTISNPFNVKLVSSSLKNQGEQIFVIADRVNAIGAINASGFVDPNGRGNGGVATGIVIENKNVKYDSSGNKEYVAGLTEKGHLVTGYYTASELINLEVKYAAGFKPQLIVNGEKMITEGDGGWGIGPRTAIGQKKDGSMVFIVIDGRQLHSVGATLKEVQDILYKNGVVNAMSMDGGSSASMYFDGENITTPSSVGNIPRYLPNIWAVVPKDNQKVKIYNEGKLIEEYTNENK